MIEKDIILDQDKFSKAATDMTKLSERIKAFKNEINGALGDLQSGFDTSAGRKFVNLCRNSLVERLDDLADIVDHTKDNLLKARTEYESVFVEYDQVNNAIKGIKIN